MKYRQLTTEQLNEMHEEFAMFLATQKIDADKWQEIKDTKPEVVAEEINLFSDLVWEKVLGKIKYLTNFSGSSLNLFRFDEELIQRIVVKCEKGNFDFSKKEDYQWFIDNSKDKTISYFKGQKAFFKERNMEIFELIEKGCTMDKGDLYELIYKMIDK
ncbi:MAG TPA: hypothetical protein EYG80_00435 [Flavobacteriaceae bacterium]|nr:hypothetical protein [Flavobacteriaceae bacterium]HIP26106.1 hypothetical protein [Flavobacteriaceae bacterium]